MVLNYITANHIDFLFYAIDLSSTLTKQDYDYKLVTTDTDTLSSSDLRDATFRQCGL